MHRQAINRYHRGFVGSLGRLGLFCLCRQAEASGKDFDSHRVDENQFSINWHQLASIAYAICCRGRSQ